MDTHSQLPPKPPYKEMNIKKIMYLAKRVRIYLKEEAEYLEKHKRNYEYDTTTRFLLDS